jgi:hypothetical protein
MAYSDSIGNTRLRQASQGSKYLPMDKRMFGKDVDEQKFGVNVSNVSLG